MTQPEQQHLTPDVIAAYADRVATPGDRKNVEAHLRLCAECRRELAVVSNVIGRRRRARALTVAIPFAAAAVLALVAVCLPDAREVQTGNEAVFRTVEGEESARIEVVAPADMDTVQHVPVEFIWRSVSADAYYKLTVTDANGDVVWTHNTADTSVVLAGETDLAAGTTYYWYVDALLERGQSVSTGVSRFVISR